MVAQEILKVISGKDEPVQGALLYHAHWGDLVHIPSTGFIEQPAAQAEVEEILID